MINKLKNSKSDNNLNIFGNKKDEIPTFHAPPPIAPIDEFPDADEHLKIKWNKFLLPNFPILDTRLPQRVVDTLWEYIYEADEDHSKHLAGNISESKTLIDTGNFFLEVVLEPIFERYLYETSITKTISKKHDICLDGFWVNYQNKHEFNPVHHHGGVFSFVIWMKIPYHWEEEQKLPHSANSNAPSSGDFAFAYTDILGRIQDYKIKLSSKDEGLMVVFPSSLPHTVYPFYTSDSERISISGNILWR